MGLFVRHFKPAGLLGKAEAINNVRLRDVRSLTLPKDHMQSSFAILRRAEFFIDTFSHSTSPAVFSLGCINLKAHQWLIAHDADLLTNRANRVCGLAIISKCKRNDRWSTVIHIR